MDTDHLRIMVLTGSDRPDILEARKELEAYLHGLPGIEVVGVYSSDEIIPDDRDAQMAVVLGGDGSILRGCRQLSHQQLPIIGVNLGRLGFLTDLSPAEFRRGLPLLQRGEYTIVEHLMFRCSHHQADGTVVTDLGLNEVTVTSAGSLKMVDIALEIDEEDITTFSCDGLIISTPVGSTAHNLSAGGPILRQDLNVFVITPICPHTLTVRPIVDSANRVFRLSIQDSPPGVMVVIDGQIRRPFQAHEFLEIRRADETFKLIRLPGHSYYGTLHRKLGWQGQLDYRERRGQS